MSDSPTEAFRELEDKQVKARRDGHVAGVPQATIVGETAKDVLAGEEFRACTPA